MRKIHFRWAVLFSMLIVPLARADDPAGADKSQYTLFNPTPVDSMRHWYTDHAVQSPYTIDAGHFEGDLTALEYGYFHRSSAASGRTDQIYAIGGTEIKAGLLNNVDLELSIVPYTFRTDNFRGNNNRDFKNSGVDDLESRIKWNLWGNDGGPTSLAVGGTIDWPTGTGSIGTEQFEAGVIADFQAHLPCGTELRIHTTAFSIVDDFTGAEKRRFSFENEISLSHQIVGGLEGYGMFNTEAYTTPGRDWEGSIGVGLNYRIRPNVELFAIMGFGVQGEPFDYEPSFGVSARF